VSRWFRMYNEALDDPKVQSLSPADFKGWINLLLLACRKDGCLPAEDDVAFNLRLNLPTARKLIKTLTSKGLIDPTGTDDSVGMPHGWNSRQYKSDVSTDRVKRFRNGARNVSSTVSETAPETEADTEPETEAEPITYQGNAGVIDRACVRGKNSLAGNGGGDGNPF